MTSRGWPDGPERAKLRNKRRKRQAPRPPGPRPGTDEMSLSLSFLDALTPDGPGEQLVITATDSSGTETAKEIVPREIR